MTVIVSPEEFSWRVSRVGLAITWAAAIGLAGGGVALASRLLFSPEPGRGAAVIGVAAAVLVAGGLALGRHARLRPRARVRIGPEGIGADGFLGTVFVPWEEVVALRIDRRRTDDSPSTWLVYRVRGRAATVTFSEALRDVDVLVDRVRRATGLAWE